MTESQVGLFHQCLVWIGSVDTMVSADGRIKIRETHATVDAIFDAGTSLLSRIVTIPSIKPVSIGSTTMLDPSSRLPRDRRGLLASRPPSRNLRAVEFGRITFLVFAVLFSV